MRKALGLTSVVLLMLTGCQSTPEYSCDSEDVRTTTVELARDGFNAAMSRSFTEVNEALRIQAFSRKNAGQITDYQVNDDYENIEFSLNNIRTKGQDKELGNYQCQATLTGSKEGVDRNVDVDIEYTAEAVDNGENFYVEIPSLTNEELGRFAFLLLDYY